MHKTAKLVVEERTVYLYKNGELFGSIDASSNSLLYIEDIIDNWESGILTEDNPNILKRELLT